MNEITNVNSTNSVKDLIARYKSERGIIKAFMERLPLYNQALGNHQYESADLAIRKEISIKISALKEPLRKIEEGLVKKNLINLIGKTEPAMSLLEKVSFEINSASYGLSGLGSSVKPSPMELESLTEYDFSLLKAVEDLDRKINEFKDSTASSPESGVLEMKISEICNEIETLDKAFKERKNVFLKL